jgi:hypothetical protein
MLGNEGKLVSRLGGNAKYWFHYLQGRLQKNYKKKNKVLICPLVVKGQTPRITLERFEKGISRK